MSFSIFIGKGFRIDLLEKINVQHVNSATILGHMVFVTDAQESDGVSLFVSAAHHQRSHRPHALQRRRGGGKKGKGERCCKHSARVRIDVPERIVSPARNSQGVANAFQLARTTRDTCTCLPSQPSHRCCCTLLEWEKTQTLQQTQLTAKHQNNQLSVKN